MSNLNRRQLLVAGTAGLLAAGLPTVALAAVEETPWIESYMYALIIKSMQQYVGDVNDSTTRWAVKHDCDSILLEQSDIAEHIVICDERNNTPLAIGNNQLVVDILYKKTTSSNRFGVMGHRFRITSQGISVEPLDWLI